MASEKLSEYMDQLDVMRMFVAVAQRRSLTSVGDAPGLPGSSLTKTLQRLDTQRGARLLHRATQHVEQSQDGELYLLCSNPRSRAVCPL
jgi:DNA-binding transcriptional LysR family regulator